MAGESSSSMNNKTASQNADSYIGTFLSVTSKSDIRYEGTVCYLNLDDCTLGLKDVRSYGTEGRKTSGAEIPPSDKVYQCIVFRGSDIKDMESKAAPPTQIEEPIHNDPAIIQANYFGESSFSSKPVLAGAGTLTDFKSCSEPTPLNAISYLSTSSPNYSVTQSGLLDSSHATCCAFSSSGMPKQWQGYREVPTRIAGAHQPSLSSSTELYRPQNQSPTSIALSNLSYNVPPAHLLSTPSSINLNTTPDLTPEQHHLPVISSFSSTFPAFNRSTLGNSNGLTVPFPLTYQSTSNVGAPVAQSSTYPTPSVSGPISDPLLRQQPTFPTPNQCSHPKLYELSPSTNSYPRQPDIIANFSAQATAPTVQPPLLPLPPPSRKIRNDSQFTEEFDFEAMNEKFKKDEIWEDLGKRSQRDKMEGMQDNGTRSSREINSDSVSKRDDTQPAYNKDEFFDTISCHSVGRGARNGQNQLSERIKFNSETFGSSGRGNHRSQHNRGRGYESHSRGRGANQQR